MRGSITSSSCSGSSLSASVVNPETSAKSAVISRRSSGIAPPASTSRSATCPATKLRSVSLTSSADAGAASETASAARPQCPQKRVPGGFSPLHELQDHHEATAVPQCPQKRIPASTGCPQDAHGVVMGGGYDRRPGGEPRQASAWLARLAAEAVEELAVQLDVFVVVLDDGLRRLLVLVLVEIDVEPLLALRCHASSSVVVH
jgi:hypothetical protein